MKAPMRDPRAPRTTVSRTPMFCLPGRTSRASGPTIAPATRAIRMVPIMTSRSSLVARAKGDGDRWARHALIQPLTPVVPLSHAWPPSDDTAYGRGRRRPPTWWSTALLVVRWDAGCVGGERCSPRQRSVGAEAHARLALCPGRDVDDRRGRNDDAPALVIGQLEHVGPQRRLDGGEDLVGRLRRLEGDLARHVLHADA